MSLLRNFGRILIPQAVVSRGSSFFPRLFGPHLPSFSSPSFLQQQSRGIRVKVINGNLEQAIQVMQRKMVSSGMERLIRRAPTHHLKNSDKRILAQKNLQKRIKSQDLARKLRTILIKKVRGL
ncbi:uncharacterized protein LOC116249827 [Nymphaea colorata]|uniref:uncharacterized protein LOC116249827 n=1 Tax=Nymphaea colorata TaxID=210225 RepID=UPI00129E4A6D|nr:uncharacterized protein LOC116249827 [Nymphaea colorata]